MIRCCCENASQISSDRDAICSDLSTGPSEWPEFDCRFVCHELGFAYEGLDIQHQDRRIDAAKHNT